MKEQFKFRKCATALTVHTKLLSHVQLCEPIDCSLPGSSVHAIIPARILQWAALFSSRATALVSPYYIDLMKCKAVERGKGCPGSVFVIPRSISHE